MCIHIIELQTLKRISITKIDTKKSTMMLRVLATGRLISMFTIYLFIDKFIYS